MKMVCTRNRRRYSVQPDRSGQVKRNTRAIPGIPFLRKEDFEDTRVFIHSPRSVTTTFDTNSEPELIQVDYLRVKALSSGKNRNISVPVQILVQRSQRGSLGNMSKRLAGSMNSYLHIKTFLCQEKTIELFLECDPLSCKDKVKKIKNWLKSQIILYIEQKKELEMTQALEKEGTIVSTSSKADPEQSKDNPQKTL
ncbi:hypothetical protein O181_074614 [Austropuccinia psidii MF-1]|uniref:Uncharacterized protein n=1 Tax=Austropuccinia psidii MF-1 TaxID=1389203 RepID=A0A9Q3F8X4_9BASI|nr:hypothetical protein [Austropuccinia psidii MF-1]